MLSIHHSFEFTVVIFSQLCFRVKQYGDAAAAADAAV